jgi:hypothetical protein
MQQRIRWSRGSADVQTSQWQAIIGTPCDVPVPMKMTSIVFPLRNRLKPGK